MGEAALDVGAGTPNEDRMPGSDFGAGLASVARSTLMVLAANVSSSLLGVVRVFYMARMMMPAEYGVWSIVAAMLGYASYGDLSINNGFLLRASSLVGRGCAEEAARMQRQVLTATLLVAGLAAVLVFIVSFGPAASVGSLAQSIRIVAAGIVTLALLNYCQVVARLQDRWKGIGLATFTTAAVATVGLILAGTATGRLSVEIAALFSVLGSATAVLVLGYRGWIRPAWPLDWNTVRNVVAAGLPVTLFPVGFILFQSADRWIVAGAVSRAHLGYYGLGTTVGAFLYMVPTTLAVVLFSRQIAEFAASGDPRTSEAIVLPPIQVSAYVMAWLAGAMVLAMPFIIRYLAPAYGPSLPVARLQVIGNCLLFSIPVGCNFLISINQNKRLFAVVGSGVAFKVILVSLFVRTAWGIDGAAWAVLVSDLLLCGTVALLCFRYIGIGLIAQLKKVALSFVPFALCLPVAVWLQTGRGLSGTLAGDSVRLLWMGMAYLMVSGTLCVMAGRISGLFDQPFLAMRIKRHLPGPLVAVLLGNRRGA